MSNGGSRRGRAAGHPALKSASIARLGEARDGRRGSACSSATERCRELVPLDGPARRRSTFEVLQACRCRERMVRRSRIAETPLPEGGRGRRGRGCATTTVQAGNALQQPAVVLEEPFKRRALPSIGGQVDELHARRVADDGDRELVPEVAGAARTPAPRQRPSVRARQVRRRQPNRFGEERDLVGFRRDPLGVRLARGRSPAASACARSVRRTRVPPIAVVFLAQGAVDRPRRCR